MLLSKPGRSELFIGLSCSIMFFDCFQQARGTLKGFQFARKLCIHMSFVFDVVQSITLGRLARHLLCSPYSFGNARVLRSNTAEH